MMIDDLTLGVLIAATTTGAVLLGTAIHLHRVAERHRRAVQEDLDWQEKSWRRHQSEEREAEDRSAWRAERQREAEIATDEYLADQARRLDEARARMAARARDEPNSPYAGHWNVAMTDGPSQNQRHQDRYRRYLNQRNTTEPREVGKAPELAMGFGGTSFDSGSGSCSSD